MEIFNGLLCGMYYREPEYSQNYSRICVIFIKFCGCDPYSLQMFQREALLGHKINLTAGKSNLAQACQFLKGNPLDISLFKPTIKYVFGKKE